MEEVGREYGWDCGWSILLFLVGSEAAIG